MKIDTNKYNIKKKLGYIYNRKDKRLKIDIYDYDVFKSKTVELDGVEVLVPQVLIIYSYKKELQESWLHLGTEPITAKYKEPIKDSDRFIITPDKHLFFLDDMIEIADVL